MNGALTGELIMVRMRQEEVIYRAQVLTPIHNTCTHHNRRINVDRHLIHLHVPLILELCGAWPETELRRIRQISISTKSTFTIAKSEG